MIRVSSVEGNRQRLDGGSMFGNVPRPVWEKWHAPDAAGRIELACRALLVEIGETKILFETGIGGFFEPRFAARFGVGTPDRHVLLENLAGLGVAAADVDYVVLSHLHFDHAGGLLSLHRDDGGRSLVFPKAEFLVGADAWARANHPHPRDRASFVAHLPGLLEGSGRLIVVGREPVPAAIRDHIEFIYTNGHTPGQMHALVKGARDSVFFCGDLVPGRAWAHVPVSMGYDRFPELIVDEKAEILPRAARERWWTFFCHDPEVAFARVEKTGDRFGCRDEAPAWRGFDV